MTAWDIECFRPAEEYNASIESLVAHLHASRARPGSGQVTLPGDEARRLGQSEAAPAFR
jgi:LDH2 family malate/lactate/ureidoglycolate dehydrogenase